MSAVDMYINDLTPVQKNSCKS